MCCKGLINTNEGSDADEYVGKMPRGCVTLLALPATPSRGKQEPKKRAFGLSPSGLGTSGL